jgi:hypothetical protein
MATSIDVTCNHSLVTGTYTHFPCQINLTPILVAYPDIKAEISAASDVNVYELSTGIYVPVYVDLYLPDNKLLLYFDGAINGSTNKTFRVTFGDVSSTNSYTVFSNYYDRVWKFNTPPSLNDLNTYCLASGTYLHQGGGQQHHSSQFYLSWRCNDKYCSTSAIPSVLLATQLTIHFRMIKYDMYPIGTGYFAFIDKDSDKKLHIYQNTSNDLYFYLLKGAIPIRMWISTSSWMIGKWYDIVIKLDFTALTDALRGRMYVDGVEFITNKNGPWSSYVDTGWLNGTYNHLLGELGANNGSWVDSIGFMPGLVSDEFIYTSANQYLFPDTFWTISNIGGPSVTVIDNITLRTFVNHKVTFEPVSSGSDYFWSFGDGATSTKENPTHAYKKAGKYTVTLIIDGNYYTLLNYVVVFESSFILDAGAVYINYGQKNQMLLGATEGGNLFGVDQDYRYMSFDNVNSNQLIGAHRLTNCVPKIIANFIEINYRLLNIIMPGSNITFNSDLVTIKRALRKLINNDYIKNVAIVAEHGGTGCYIVFKILNVITIEDIQIPFEDSKESVIEVTFAGCFSENNYDTEPWEIDTITS